MEAEDYKTLLKQAEDELGTTPGAYCSRKVAVRAMELLRDAGQQQFDDMEAKWRATGQEAIDAMKNSEKIIDAQAQAIKNLQEDKSVRLGSGIDSPAKLVWVDTKEGFREPRYIAGGDPVTGQVTVQKLTMNPDKYREDVYDRVQRIQREFQEAKQAAAPRPLGLVKKIIDSVGKPWTEY